MLSTVLDDLGIPMQSSAFLSEFTTFRLGGPCKGLLTCQTPAELEKAIHVFLDNSLPFILIGGGSNLVVSDEGLDCYVIRYVSDVPSIEQDGSDLIVSGSTNLDSLAQYALKQGLEGLNYATGIPGTVGGAIVGNAGAFGRQVGDVTKSVTLLTRTGIKKEVSTEELQFTYRDSILKKTGDIVLSVRFFLRPGNQEALEQEREEILRIRREKHPDSQRYPCAGSFFRNIEPTSKAGKRQAAGWFLEQAGGKELFHGGAKIFEQHANIIVKTDGGCAQDVFELSKKMSQLVKEHFNLDLIREVRFVGKFIGMPEDVKDWIW